MQTAQTVSTTAMDFPKVGTQQPSAFELRFWFLHKPGRALAFPCDSAGHVDMDAMSDRARMNYLAARAGIGYEYMVPQVLPTSFNA